MSISYNPLWKTLIDKKIKRYELMNIANISANVVAKMAREEFVSLRSIEKICLALDCNLNDVIIFIDPLKDSNE